MADELDAELLALAGDSSDEESSPPPKQKSESPAPSASPSSSMARKGVAKPVRRNKKSRRDDEEDGEVSDAGSHHSLESASMSESEAASDSEGSSEGGDEDRPIFPYEKLYYSAKDKEEIMAMPEIQREQILSERAQEVDRRNQDLALRRLLASRERDEARRVKKSKRKASVADLEEGQRKSSRQKTTLGGRKVGEASEAIEAYKRQREKKGKRDELRRRETATGDQATPKDEGPSDKDADGESEVEWDNRERSPSLPKDDPPAELRDIQRARVGRTNFAQVCFYPRFDECISGCYARVNIGPNRDSGNNEYRLCLIKRFTVGRPYAMEGPNGRSFVTNQYAVLAHGKAEREFPFVACSDSPFTEAEFSRYRQTMAVEDCKIATKSTLAEKVADINRLLNHQFTKEELNEKLRKQGSLDNKMRTFKRLETEKQLKLARAAGDDEEVSKLEKELAELAGPKLAVSSHNARPRSKKPSDYERLAELNFRNQKLNTESVRRAQLEERRANRKAAAAVARGEAQANPFMRVRTLARTHYDANGNSLTPDSTASRNETPATASETPSKAGTPKPTGHVQKKQSKGGVATIRHRNMDDENIAALDLDIDIEI
ncbi:RNA polymerase-associated protein [Aspergillus clavatus NRRL 1]|uniref:RNA polymerase II transcription elongation factor Rtf1p, putative n=1 Tax=Aspergillus clavatus (strain ATCC 1007 / CBS 513.65 / DSM 816 / NCTC 3887 / NRRL 1 / QM 1276 / 107) TaxID=344612 RepID=A1CFE9_ASPCL|nr:RNA polymerase II transcription elongation factor Rtf1p, putative [Aspergillus clavatus NRRL 1]EAW11598.1 RNA polymerase II transcription elongation factor Rtf1p, putative [Aspergillus clavatus NRRL 1]